MSKIIDKIRALLAKTTAAGCTEAEALAAAQAAQRLMLEHDISTDDVREREAFVTQDRRVPRARGIADWLAGSIADYFDCRVVKSVRYDRLTGRRGAQMRFFGREADVVMADWLLETLIRTAKRDYRAWIDERRLAPDVSQTNGFYMGFAGRIAQRLDAMRVEGRAAAPASHTDLVVARNAARDAAFAVAFPDARQARHADRSTDAGAVRSGLKAGDAASLSRPVGSPAGPALLA